jgi:DNA-binding PadR family transcriptional regulator
LERCSNWFTSTGDRHAGRTKTGDNASEKIEKVEEQQQLFEDVEPKGSIEAALALDEDKEISPGLEWQAGFLGPVGDGVLEVSSDSWLVPFLLLILQEGDSCGLELTGSISGFDFGARTPSMVYQTLHQMEEEGIVVSGCEGFDGRLSYRRYSITRLGETYLEFWANSIAQYRDDVDFFLRLYNEQPAL